MPAGIRATVEFAGAELCPVVARSAEAGTSVSNIVSNICPTGESVVEFSADTEADGADVPIFSHGETDRFRLRLDPDTRCPCTCLAEFGCPVARYAVDDDRLRLVFHAADYDQLQAIIAALRDRYTSVDIRRFIRSPAAERAEDSVFVDRSKLTARQLEVLRTAHEMGYFERPRDANATAVAEALGIHPSTFREHLAAAQSKLLEDIL